MQHLIKYLEENNLRQGEFAAKVDVTQATISRICNGTYQPSTSLIQRIAKVTNNAVPVTAWFE